MSMKIVLIVDSFAPAWGYGGPPRLVATLAEQLTGLGHDVVVLTTDALASNRFRLADLENRSVVRARNLSNTLAWTRKIFLPVPPKGVLSICRQADVIHLFQPRSLLNFLGYIAAQQEGSALLLSPLGSLPLVGTWERIPKRAYDAVLLNSIRLRLQAVLGQTRHEMLLCRRWGVDDAKIHLVPLCVNLSEYSVLPSKGRFVSRFPELKSSEQMFIFIGRIHKFKGLEMTLRAFSRAFPNSNHALVIAGKDEGGHVAYLKSLASKLKLADRVLFPGPLYGSAKLEALVDAHAFVITPSIYEETSLAALEAAACKTPVVTTAQAEIPWLDEYSGGLTVQYDLESVTEGLVTISGIVGERRLQMGTLAQRLVYEHFSPTKVAKETELIYRSCRPLT